MACLRTSIYSLFSVGLLVGCLSKSKNVDIDATDSDPPATTTDATAGKPTSTDTAATDTAATDTAATDTAATDTAATTVGPIEPSGPNPCGTCEPGSYCNNVPTDDEDCGVTACSTAFFSPHCEPCMSAPSQCDPRQLAECVHNVCADTAVVGYGIAEDGVLVVTCEPFQSTGCPE